MHLSPALLYYKDEEDDEMSDETMSDEAESDSRNVDKTVTGVELQEWTEEWAEQNNEILMNAAAGIDNLFGATGNLETSKQTRMHTRKDASTSEATTSFLYYSS
jgi:hypothetical protein